MVTKRGRPRKRGAREELCWCGWLRTNGKAHTHNPNFDDGFVPPVQKLSDKP